MIRDVRPCSYAQTLVASHVQAASGCSVE